MARRKKTDQTDAAGTALVLSGVLDISSAQQLQKTLSDALDAGGPLRIDAREVERVDASAMQLLYACLCAAATRGTACAWDGVSESVRAAADLCGMRESLGLAGQVL